ncbi:VOC family protein [Kineococcus sp. SYSU DK003]|uniref:VOC family protein n=1 Tax=Kineococcus sp. SYSU DK003 TaxID=3383124 RepID=UPI003D7DAEFC
MKIAYTSVFVQDQDKALAFYTEVLGFVKKVEVPVGEHRWLTVVSPEDPDGVELVLEPREHPVAIAYTEGLVADGIPATAFVVDDCAQEAARLAALGVVFTQPARAVGPVTTAVFDDTVGNLLQIQSMND